MVFSIQPTGRLLSETAAILGLKDFLWRAPIQAELGQARRRKFAAALTPKESDQEGFIFPFLCLLTAPTVSHTYWGDFGRRNPALDPRLNLGLQCWARWRADPAAIMGSPRLAAEDATRAITGKD